MLFLQDRALTEQKSRIPAYHDLSVIALFQQATGANTASFAGNFKRVYRTFFIVSVDRSSMNTDEFGSVRRFEEVGIAFAKGAPRLVAYNPWLKHRSLFFVSLSHLEFGLTTILEKKILCYNPEKFIFRWINPQYYCQLISNSHLLIFLFISLLIFAYFLYEHGFSSILFQRKFHHACASFHIIGI